MSFSRARRMAKVPPDSIVCAAALSRRTESSGRDAVLLIHGFGGVVSEMEFLGLRLSEAGFSVSIPRLPGHGTNHRDFLSVSWHDWYRRCLDEYLELASTYDRVYVAGLSMGGLLAVLLAAQVRPPRIVLAAPALLTTNPYLRFAPVARYFVRSIATAADVMFEESDPQMRYLNAEYKERRWVGPVAELRLLQRRALARLGRIESDILTIVSKGDRTVPFRVADLIEAKVRSPERRRLVLEESGHVVVDDVERELVAKEVTDWFRR